MCTWLQQIQQLDTQKLERAAPWVCALLILMLCWKLAALFWWVIAPPQALQMQNVQLGSQQPRIPNITAFSLFSPPSNTTNNDANSNLQLQGVVVGMPARYSSAVIKVNDVAERYRVGETVGNSGYVLSEVYWDKVVLQQGTAIKELQFKGIDKGLYQPVTLAPANSSSNANTMGNSSALNTPVQEPSPNAAIGQAIQQIQDNRQQYFQNMGVNASGGQGYEVTERTPAALRNKLGLRAGDRIISLNGQVVGSGQNDAQLLEQARREGQVKIEIKRGDQTMTIQQEF